MEASSRDRQGVSESTEKGEEKLATAGTQKAVGNCPNSTCHRGIDLSKSASPILLPTFPSPPPSPPSQPFLVFHPNSSLVIHSVPIGYMRSMQTKSTLTRIHFARTRSRPPAIPTSYHRISEDPSTALSNDPSKTSKSKVAHPWRADRNERIL